jgi:hypothetical protein
VKTSGKVAEWQSEKKQMTMTTRITRSSATSPLRHSQGQSIIEYVILITVLGLLILALRGRVESAVNNLYNAATDKIDEAATDLRGM